MIKPSFIRHSALKLTINVSILDTLLQLCRCLKEFKQIHCQMIATGLVNDTFAASRLVGFSTNSTLIDLQYSRCIIDHVENPNAFSWNNLMRAYLRRNCPETVIFLYKMMLEKPLEPDNYTFPILVQACTVRFSEQEGQMIHNHVLKLGYESDLYVQNTLINMYAVCGNLIDARLLFDTSPVLDSVSWNSILSGYVMVSDVEEAVSVFRQMPEKNTIASNSVIALFGKNGRVHDARTLFDEMPTRDIVSWTTMISSYEQNGMFDDALKLFSLMCKEGIILDEVVALSALSACANLLAIRGGESIHGLAVTIGIESYVNLQNALIHMYSNCGKIIEAQKLFDISHHLDQISWNSMISGYLRVGLVEKARRLFDRMPIRDTVSWSAMISGYAQQDRFSEALSLFQKMQLEEIKPEVSAIVSVISSCARLSAINQGKWIHAYIRRNGVHVDAILGATLIDMYMKFGSVENAMEVFHQIEEKGVSNWNAVIFGLTMNGLIKESLEKFEEMRRHGITPNEITFVGVLCACRHAGLVEKGRGYFESMMKMHNIEPNVKHYGCMVDLLARAGLLKEAEKLIESMPMKPDIATWGALLGACRKHGNIELGERIGRKLIELEPSHDGFHVLLSNMYASKGKWDDVIEVRERLRNSGVSKIPGCSIMEVDGVVHEFMAGDFSYPQAVEVEEMLNEMAKRLKLEGYEPDTNAVALDIDEEEKQTSLFGHSEKHAIAFGLINTRHPLPIRIMKNLRICGDCHSVAKIISKAFCREIIIRDRHLFHHFKEGSCSCKDYW